MKSQILHLIEHRIVELDQLKNAINNHEMNVADVYQKIQALKNEQQLISTFVADMNQIAKPITYLH